MEFSGIGKGELTMHSLNAGNVFIGDFEGITHKKYFIIAGVSGEKMFFCSVFINSNFPKYFYSNKTLLGLQVNIKGAKYNFLNHDSFVSCNNPFQYPVRDLAEWINNDMCRYVGDVDSEDLENITQTIINSGALTKKEINQYFKI